MPRNAAFGGRRKKPKMPPMQVVNLADVDPSNPAKSEFVCPQCHEEFTGKKILHKHLATAHEIKYSWKTLTFASEDEFLRWKTQIEEVTDAAFTKHSQNNTNTGFFQYFRCTLGANKPIVLVDKLTGQKVPTKINTHCPSELVYNYDRSKEAGKQYIARYQVTHVGHQFKLPSLPKSSKKDRTRPVFKSELHKGYMDKVTSETADFNDTELREVLNLVAAIKARPKPGKRAHISAVKPNNKKAKVNGGAAQNAQSSSPVNIDSIKNKLAQQFEAASSEEDYNLQDSSSTIAISDTTTITISDTTSPQDECSSLEIPELN